jgi:uncharacterized protein (TIGR03083 family)
VSATATKANVERELVEAWQALASAVDSFSDVELEQPGVVEGWSVKDLLGHIAFWAQEAARNLRLIGGGKANEVRSPSSDRDVDEWNERERRLRQGRPLPDIREEWLESFQEAMQALAAFPSQKLQEEFEGRTVLELFAVDTYDHYREHLAQLAGWRQDLERSEA